MALTKTVVVVVVVVVVGCGGGGSSSSSSSTSNSRHRKIIVLSINCDKGNRRRSIPFCSTYEYHYDAFIIIMRAVVCHSEAACVYVQCCTSS